MNDPVLETRDLSIRFGGLVAVDKVSLTVQRSEILGIIGPNGAGKSTLLNLISGIYQATEGDVLLEGQSIAGQPAHRIVKKGIARTFQSSRLFNDLTVLDNVIIGMHTRTDTGVLEALLMPGRAKRKLEAAAEKAGALLNAISKDLYARRGTLAGALPQADRRRLEIARALASEPKLIMLDEPSSGMDDRDTDALMEDVRRITQERAGISFLIIEHDMRLVSSLPDRVVVIDYGRKIADGQFADIRRMPDVQEAYLGQKV
ncbi:ABC transporter ATP-binding protein [Sulfitobacter aestuarii]|uniref:ABC transporter ATP-binding protein n=1 Tax=Sulfitobacter aestuarii TaxID=2161676 RepID=A0ABW5U837_9RHOB